MDVGREWDLWLREHGAALLLLARQLSGSDADAEDAVQEGFIRFWRSRHRAADAAAYLYSCVRNCAYERMRSERRRTQRERETACSELFVQRPEQDERRPQIERALTCLPREQREVLVMKIWGKLSFPQIADAMGTSRNTAASRYRYALACLRALLPEEI